MNKIALKEYSVEIKTSEYDKLDKSEIINIALDDVEPEEIKTWDIEDKEEAIAELAKYKCKSKRYDGNVFPYYLVTVYALEYYTANEDGEFISGSDMDTAEWE